MSSASSSASSPPGAAPKAAASTATDAEKAAKARAKVDADHQAELERWTPELHAGAKRLSETSYPTIDAALKAVLMSPHRQLGNAARDQYAS